MFKSPGRAQSTLAPLPPASRSAPSLKRPRTPAVFATIGRAEEKRKRKAEKRRRDFAHTAEGAATALQVIKLNSNVTRRDAAIRAEALDVVRELEAETAL